MGDNFKGQGGTAIAGKGPPNSHGNRRMYRFVSLSCTLAIAISAPALLCAQHMNLAPLLRAHKVFSVADASGDDRLNRDELAAARLPETALGQWDLDGDESLSRAEFYAYYSDLVRLALKARGQKDEFESQRPLAASREVTAGAGAALSTAAKYRRARAALDVRLGCKSARGPGSSIRVKLKALHADGASMEVHADPRQNSETRPGCPRPIPRSHLGSLT